MVSSRVSLDDRGRPARGMAVPDDLKDEMRPALEVEAELQPSGRRRCGHTEASSRPTHAIRNDP